MCLPTLRIIAKVYTKKIRKQIEEIEGRFEIEIKLMLKRRTCELFLCFISIVDA